tara:strand:+ start:1147 stop:2559 length:1413 start_codon:yes stop_codon:yes gene_type:complete
MAVRSTIGTQYAPGQNPYDTYVSLEGAAKDIEADIERSQVVKQREEQKRLRDMQLADIKSKNMQGLMLSSETAYEPLQNYMQSMSRNLVDQYSDLVIKFDNGDIDSTYFAAETTKLQGQVPQVKGMVDAISATAGSYAEGLTNGTLSGAIPVDQEMYFQAILDNRGNFAVDDNNILVFQGETADGTPFSIPANKLNQMPQPIGKVDDFQSLILPTVETMMQPKERSIGGRVVNASVLGPTADNPAGSQEWQNGIAASFDKFLDIYKEDGLKSLAVDHAGYTIEEMNDALNSGSYEGPDGEQFSSRLEYDMERLYHDKAAENYVYKEMENANQLANDNKRIALQIQQQNADTARINAERSRQSGRTESERQNYKSAQYLSEKVPMPTRENITTWGSGLPTGDKTVGFQNGKYYIVEKGNAVYTIPDSTLDNPNDLAKLLSSQIYNIPAYDINFNYKVGPLNKLANFFKRKK